MKTKHFGVREKGKVYVEQFEIDREIWMNGEVNCGYLLADARVDTIFFLRCLTLVCIKGGFLRRKLEMV